MPSPGTARPPASAPASVWSSAGAGRTGLLAGRVLRQRADRRRDDRRSHRAPPRDGRASGRFDLVGALPATLGRRRAGVRRSSSPPRRAGPRRSPSRPVVAGVVLLAVLVVIERRAAQPIMPLRLFASRGRTGAYARPLALPGRDDRVLLLHHPVHAGRLGFNPLQAGIGFLPMTAVNFAVAMGIPRLDPRCRPRRAARRRHPDHPRRDGLAQPRRRRPAPT